jgi:hypothetical protein
MADAYTGKQAAQYIPGGAYGEGGELMALQTAPGVNMAASEVSAEQMGAVANAVPMAKPTLNFNTPNPNRDVPITDGAGFGPGRGSEALPIPPQAVDQTAQLILSLAELYPDPDLTRLAAQVKAQGRG